MTDLQMVQTTDGVLVNNGPNGSGYTPEQASASVKDRNDRAAQMGIDARYEAVPFVPTPKG